MKISTHILGSFLAVSACSAQPVAAQTILPSEQNGPSLVDTGRGEIMPPSDRQTFSLSSKLGKNTNLSLQYQRASDRYEASERNRLPKWQISPDAELKWKGVVGAKFTYKFK